MDGETLVGWGAIERSPYGRIDIVFGPVLTTEAHLAFSGARTHSNNTVEMTAMVEALSFLGPRGPVARDVVSCFFMTPNMLPVCPWARFKPAHMSSWHLPVNESTLSVQHRLRLTMQHLFGHTRNLSNFDVLCYKGVHDSA